MTLRLYYATQVWQEALLVFSKEDIYDSCFGKPRWKDEGSGFRFVEFEQTNGIPLTARIARFWEILKEIANPKKNLYTNRQFAKARHLKMILVAEMNKLR